MSEAAAVEKISWSVKRSRELFSIPVIDGQNVDDESQKLHIQVKFRSRYDKIPEIQPSQLQTNSKKTKVEEEHDISETKVDIVMTGHPYPSTEGVDVNNELDMSKMVEDVVENMKETNLQATNQNMQKASAALVEYKKETKFANEFGSTAIIRRRHAVEVPKPQWHAPWKLKRVIAGHLGWVRAIAVDPTNEWFVTGAADRSIKV